MHSGGYQSVSPTGKPESAGEAFFYWLNMKKVINLVGNRYGRLQVLSQNFTKSRTAWDCICDCGSSAIVASSELRGGVTKSCGCYQRQQTSLASKTHGQSKGSKTYKSWSDMKRRCYSKNNKNYSDYGGRGIYVCDEWRHSFESFYDFMGEKPDGMTLERINVNDGYRPGNCEWKTQVEQVRNARSNWVISINGNSMLCDDLSKIVNLSPQTVREYVRRGIRTIRGINFEANKRG